MFNFHRLMSVVSIVGLTSSAIADSMTTYPFPLYTDISAEIPVSTNLFVGFSVETFDPPITDLAGFSGDADEELGVQVLQALINDDWGAYESLSGGRKTAESDFRLMQLGYFKQLSSHACALGIEQVIRVNDFTILNARCPDADWEAFKKSFAVILQESPSGLVENIQAGYEDWINPFLQLEDARMLHPGNFAPVTSPGTEFEVVVDEFEGVSGSNPPLTVRFDGFRPDWGAEVIRLGEFIVAEAPENPSAVQHYELMRFYRDTWLTFTSIPNASDLGPSEELETTDGYIAFKSRLSPASAEDLAEVMEDEELIGTYRDQKMLGIHVDFVIDCDPVYFFVYKTLRDFPAGRYGFDVVQRNGSTFNLVNIMVPTNFESLLNSSSVHTKFAQFVEGLEE